MAQYMLSVHNDDTPQYAKDELQEVFAAVDRFNDSLQEAGSWVFGGGLEPIGHSTVVDGRAGETLVTDGPFAETKEHLGGFWIIEAPDLRAAQRIAADASAACRQPVEVRPFQSE
jgi:hypothetical protein